MTFRGTIADFNGWVSLGNKGWGWDDLLPYFLKASLPWKKEIGDDGRS